MAEPEDSFYSYRTTFRVYFSEYVADKSTLFGKIGLKSKEAQIDIVKMTAFKMCMQVLDTFDPLSDIHMFTASEMYDFQDRLNELNDTSYNLVWENYY